MTKPEGQTEEKLIEKHRSLKYEYRPEIRDRVALKTTLREKFHSFNFLYLIDGQFQRLLDETITTNVIMASCSHRTVSALTREDQA